MIAPAGEDDYDMALLAAHLASLKNAPLIFSDEKISGIDNYENVRDAYILGNIENNIIRKIGKKTENEPVHYKTIKDVQKAIIDISEPGYIILTDPKDIEDDNCEKGSYKTPFGGLNNISCKDSLASSLLAVLRNGIITFSYNEPIRKEDSSSGNDNSKSSGENNACALDCDRKYAIDDEGVLLEISKNGIRRFSIEDNRKLKDIAVPDNLLMLFRNADLSHVVTAADDRDIHIIHEKSSETRYYYLISRVMEDTIKYISRIKTSHKIDSFAIGNNNLYFSHIKKDGAENDILISGYDLSTNNMIEKKITTEEKLIEAIESSEKITISKYSTEDMIIKVYNKGIIHFIVFGVEKDDGEKDLFTVIIGLDNELEKVYAKILNGDMSETETDMHGNFFFFNCEIKGTEKRYFIYSSNDFVTNEIIKEFPQCAKVIAYKDKIAFIRSIDDISVIKSVDLISGSSSFTDTGPNAGNSREKEENDIEELIAESVTSSHKEFNDFIRDNEDHFSRFENLYVNIIANPRFIPMDLDNMLAEDDYINARLFGVTGTDSVTYANRLFAFTKGDVSYYPKDHLTPMESVMIINDHSTTLRTDDSFRNIVDELEKKKLFVSCYQRYDYIDDCNTLESDNPQTDLPLHQNLINRDAVIYSSDILTPFGFLPAHIAYNDLPVLQSSVILMNYDKEKQDFYKSFNGNFLPANIIRKGGIAVSAINDGNSGKYLEGLHDMSGKLIIEGNELGLSFAKARSSLKGSEGIIFGDPLLRFAKTNAELIQDRKCEMPKETKDGTEVREEEYLPRIMYCADDKEQAIANAKIAKELLQKKDSYISDIAEKHSSWLPEKSYEDFRSLVYSIAEEDEEKLLAFDVEDERIEIHTPLAISVLHVTGREYDIEKVKEIVVNLQNARNSFLYDLQQFFKKRGTEEAVMKEEKYKDMISYWTVFYYLDKNEAEKLFIEKSENKDLFYFRTDPETKTDKEISSGRISGLYMLLMESRIFCPPEITIRLGEISDADIFLEKDEEIEEESDIIPENKNQCMNVVCDFDIKEFPEEISGIVHDKEFPDENIQVIIDPGHGHGDPGAISSCTEEIDGICKEGIILFERDMALSISADIYNSLKSKGIKPRLTRTDEGNYIDADNYGEGKYKNKEEYDKPNQASRLGYKTDIAKKIIESSNDKNKVFVSIHLNSFYNNKQGFDNDNYLKCRSSCRNKRTECRKVCNGKEDKEICKNGCDEKNEVCNDNCIYSNSYDCENHKGFKVFYYSENDKKSDFNGLSGSSKDLAENIFDSLDKLHEKYPDEFGDYKPNEGHAGPLDEEFFVLEGENTLMPSVIIETAFICNRDEIRLFSDDSLRRKIADAISEGIQNFISGSKGKIAIVLDDAGASSYTKTGIKKLKDNIVPVTFAFMPKSQYQKSAASALSGYDQSDILMHLQMEPENMKTRGLHRSLESDENKWRISPNDPITSEHAAIYDFDTPKEAAEIFNSDYEFLKNDIERAGKIIIGFNNHMGSLVTQNKALMDALASEAKKKNLIMLDSRTTLGSVLYSSGVSAGAKAVKTNGEFIDDYTTTVGTKRTTSQILESMIKSVREGENFIVIGHVTKQDTVEQIIEFNEKYPGVLVKLSDHPDVDDGIDYGQNNKDDHKEISNSNVCYDTERYEKVISKSNIKGSSDEKVEYPDDSLTGNSGKCASGVLTVMDYLFGYGTSHELGIIGKSAWELRNEIVRTGGTYEKSSDISIENLPVGAILGIKYSATAHQEDADDEGTGYTHVGVYLGNNLMIHKYPSYLRIDDISSIYNKEKRLRETDVGRMNIIEIMLPSKDILCKDNNYKISEIELDGKPISTFIVGNGINDGRLGIMISEIVEINDVRGGGYNVPRTEPIRFPSITPDGEIIFASKIPTNEELIAEILTKNKWQIAKNQRGNIDRWAEFINKYMTEYNLPSEPKTATALLALMINEGALDPDPKKPISWLKGKNKKETFFAIEYSPVEQMEAVFPRRLLVQEGIKCLEPTNEQKKQIYENNKKGGNLCKISSSEIAKNILSAKRGVLKGEPGRLLKAAWSKIKNLVIKDKEISVGPMQVKTHLVEEILNKQESELTDNWIDKFSSFPDEGETEYLAIKVGIKNFADIYHAYQTSGELMGEKLNWTYADYNSGLYSSRNSQLQKEIYKLVYDKNAPVQYIDGDIIRWDEPGEPEKNIFGSLVSTTREDIKKFAKMYNVGFGDMDADLEKEKTKNFEHTEVYREIKNKYNEKYGQSTYATVPVAVHNKWSAKEYTKRVNRRYNILCGNCGGMEHLCSLE